MIHPLHPSFVSLTTLWLRPDSLGFDIFPSKIPIASIHFKTGQEIQHACKKHLNDERCIYCYSKPRCLSSHLNTGMKMQLIVVLPVHTPRSPQIWGHPVVCCTDTWRISAASYCLEHGKMYGNKPLPHSPCLGPRSQGK